MTQVTILDDSDIESMTVTDEDEFGRVVLVESGRFEQIEAMVNGERTTIQEPMLVPKVRPIEKTKVDALKLQRNQSLDSLEKIGVKEVVEEPIIADETISRSS